MALTIDGNRRVSTERSTSSDAPVRVQPQTTARPLTVRDGFDTRASSGPYDVRSRPSTDSDGRLVGSNGQAFPPGTELSSIPATEPRQGGATQTIIYVNGQGTSPEGIVNDAQAIANATGQRVVSVYNATEGLFADTSQSLRDKLDRGDNPAVSSAAGLIYDELLAGNDVRLAAHSQGGIIVSRAINDVQERLRAEGKSESEIKALMANVYVETFGGAASRYPDGPRYTHYINQADFVPRELGLGETNPPLFDLTPNKLGVDSHPGAGATVIQFNEGSYLDRLNPGGNDHALGTYLSQYRPPDQVADHPDRVQVPGGNSVLEKAVRAVTNPVGAAVSFVKGLFG